MKVNFQSDWFGPGSKFFAKADNPHEVPDELKELLPTSAKVVGENPEPKVEPAPTVKTKI